MHRKVERDKGREEQRVSMLLNKFCERCTRYSHFVDKDLATRPYLPAENAGKYLTMLNLWKHCFIDYLIEKKLANIQYFFFFWLPKQRKGREVEIRVEKEGKK